jgi:hypothetical protein
MPPAISVQAKPESGSHTIVLAVAGVSALPGGAATRPAAPAPRSVRPYDHLGACFMPFIAVAPIAAIIVRPALPLPRFEAPSATGAGPAPRP